MRYSMEEMNEYTVLGSMEYIRRYVRPSMHQEATPPCELQQKMNLAQLKGRAIATGGASSIAGCHRLVFQGQTKYLNNIQKC